MPAADDHQERPSLTSDDLLGGLVYEAATLLPDSDLDRELAQLLSDDRRGGAIDPLPGW